MQRIHVLNNQVDYAPRYPITGKRRNMQPHTIARYARVARIRFRLIPAMRELPPETQPRAIELFRYNRAINMDERKRSRISL